MQGRGALRAVRTQLLPSGYPAFGAKRRAEGSPADRLSCRSEAKALLPKAFRHLAAQAASLPKAFLAEACCSAPFRVRRNHFRDTRGDAFACFDFQKLVWTVRVRVRSQHASHEKLGLRELLAQHAHERNRSAYAHVHRIAAKE